MAELPSTDQTLPQPLPSVPDPRRTRLGAPKSIALTSFIDREHDIEQVVLLVRSDNVCRLT